jgi:hypothetical protein
VRTISKKYYCTVIHLKKQPLVERFTLAFADNFAFLLSDEGKVRKFLARGSSTLF